MSYEMRVFGRRGPKIRGKSAADVSCPEILRLNFQLFFYQLEQEEKYPHKALLAIDRIKATNICTTPKVTLADFTHRHKAPERPQKNS